MSSTKSSRLPISRLLIEASPFPNPPTASPALFKLSPVSPSPSTANFLNISIGSFSSAPKNEPILDTIPPRAFPNPPLSPAAFNPSPRFLTAGPILATSSALISLNCLKPFARLVICPSIPPPSPPRADDIVLKTSPRPAANNPSPNCPTAGPIVLSLSALTSLNFTRASASDPRLPLTPPAAIPASRSPRPGRLSKKFDMPVAATLSFWPSVFSKSFIASANLPKPFKSSLSRTTAVAPIFRSGSSVKNVPNPIPASATFFPSSISKLPMT